MKKINSYCTAWQDGVPVSTLEQPLNFGAPPTMRQQVRSGAEGNAIEQQIQLDAAPTGLTRHRRPLHALTGIRFFAAI
jgi:hypothetical protein